MYEQFFTFFGLRDNPFDGSLDPRYLFVTPRFEKTLVEMTSAIERRNTFLLLTAEVGTGKTLLIRQLLQSLRDRGIPTAFVFYTHLDGNHLFDFMLSDFGIRCESKLKTDALKALHDWLLARNVAGETPVLLVDEAQGLSNHALHEIQMLLNLETPQRKLLQIVLSGEPDLEDKLRKPEFRKLRQRITGRTTLEPFSTEETHSYIQNRLQVAGAPAGPGDSIFSSGAVDLVDAYSRGIPRVINLLCEQALIRAHSETIRPIPAALIEDVASHFQLERGAVGLPRAGGSAFSSGSESVISLPRADSFFVSSLDPDRNLASLSDGGHSESLLAGSLEESSNESSNESVNDSLDDSVDELLDDDPVRSPAVARTREEPAPVPDDVAELAEALAAEALAAAAATPSADQRVIMLPEPPRVFLLPTERRMLGEFLNALAEAQLRLQPLTDSKPPAESKPFVVMPRNEQVSAPAAASHAPQRSRARKRQRQPHGVAGALQAWHARQSQFLSWLHQRSNPLRRPRTRGSHSKSRRPDARRPHPLGLAAWMDLKRVLLSAAAPALWRKHTVKLLGWLQQPVNPLDMRPRHSRDSIR